jgi:predicted ATPase
VQRTLVLSHGVAPGVRCLGLAANTLWCLGYPAQAVHRSQEAQALAQALAHHQSLVYAQHHAAVLHHRRREPPAVQAQADARLTLAAARGLPLWVGQGTLWQGWALAVQGQGEAGLAQTHQGLAAVLATGQELSRPYQLVLLAEAAGHASQVEKGLRWLAEALRAFKASGRGELLAEAYRLHGELLLRRALPDAAQAEACSQESSVGGISRLISPSASRWALRKQASQRWRMRSSVRLGVSS